MLKQAGNSKPAFFMSSNLLSRHKKINSRYTSTSACWKLNEIFLSVALHQLKAYIEILIRRSGKLHKNIYISLLCLQSQRERGEPDDAALKAHENLNNLRTVSTSSSMRDGSDFRIIGELRSPQEIIKRSSDFDSVIAVLQQLKCDDNFQCESHVTEKQRAMIAQRDTDVADMREQLTRETEEMAHNFLAIECCNLLKEIGPPWNWLHNFASQTCREASYNYLETIESVKSDATPNEQPSSEESFDYLNDKFISAMASVATTSTADDGKSSVSGASGISFSLYNVDDDIDAPSNNHKVLIDAICSISEASDKGECNIRETSSIAQFLDEQHSSKHLEPSDYQRLRMFIERAEERGLVFNDLNELYNYFIQESSRERSTHEVEIREEEEDEAELENVIGSTEQAQPDASEQCEKAAASKNVVSIFGESGIEVDGKLLDAKVSERMILGLVDKPQCEDNVSDVASSVSSLSQAETVKMKQLNVTREIDTQTTSYKEQIHSKRVQSKHAGKSKSASSIKRQPFACKIPKIPGIGPSMDGERLEKMLRFITHRSFQQGGFVYPRNLLEDECPSLMSER